MATCYFILWKGGGEGRGGEGRGGEGRGGGSTNYYIISIVTYDKLDESFCMETSQEALESPVLTENKLLSHVCKCWIHFLLALITDDIIICNGWEKVYWNNLNETRTRLYIFLGPVVSTIERFHCTYNSFAFPTHRVKLEVSVPVCDGSAFCQSRQYSSTGQSPPTRSGCHG